MSGDMTIKTSPFVIRHALLIALEAVYADLTAEQLDRLKRFAGRLPKDIRTREVRLDVDTIIDFALCMRRFKHTHTWYWLREDLKRPVVEFEHAMLVSKK